MMRGMRGILVALAALLIMPAAAQAAPTLSGAHFEGLTRIVATSSEDLTGIAPAEVAIAAPGGAVTPSAVTASGTTLTVDLPAAAFARTTSIGTTIAARGSAAVPVARSGEPAANAHILGSSQWTDNGWSTSLTDPAADPLPLPGPDAERRRRGQALLWNNGAVTKPAHRDLRMLVLFVQFPNRLATSSPAGWQTMQPYMDFLAARVGVLEHVLLRPAERQLRLAAGDQRPRLDHDGQEREPLHLGRADAQHVRLLARGVPEGLRPARDQGRRLRRGPDHARARVLRPRQRPGQHQPRPDRRRETNTNQPAYVDHDGKTHYVSTVITAGNDMFSWGYRWINHEFGHTVGLPDLYIYYTTIGGTRVNQFFWVGGWDIMGNIGGHANDYSGYQKYKLRWLRDDQVDVVSQPGISEHAITPSRRRGGTKIVVIRTGVSTAYVAELRTKLGVDGLDNRGRYQGVLLYRIDASQWEQIREDADMEVISKQYYNDPAVGGAAEQERRLAPDQQLAHRAGHAGRAVGPRRHVQRSGDRREDRLRRDHRLPGLRPGQQPVHGRRHARRSR